MANRKISDLTALTTPATGDLLPIVDISEAAAADKNKKITFGELFASIPAGTAAAPSVAFEGDSNTGIYSPGADQLAISTGGTSRIVVDASGNVNIDSGTFYVDAANNRVGIGTAEPVVAVHGRTDNAGSGSTPLLIQNRSTSSNTAVGISFAPNVSDTADRSAIIYGVNSSGGVGNGTDLAFYTNIDGGSPTEKTRIDGYGRLYVGTSTTGLQNVRSLLWQGFAEAALYINHSTSDGSGDPYVKFGYNAGQIGSITQSGTTAVLYNTTSDQRLKENIQDSDLASTLIDALRVRQFEWKSDRSHQRYGFVAQELVTVAPEAVHQPDNLDEMMGVDYSKLVPMLVKEVQSLRARLAAAGIA